MTLKLLAVGDLHLGRRPSRLPDSLAEQAHDLGPAEAWERTVQAAIDEGVDAVVMAGDVVEKPKDFYEGFRELQKGVKRLSDAGIRVLGVAGNHDVEILPRLADLIEDFHLIGRGGHWEDVNITAGSESLTIWGWSFPQAKVKESPFSSMRFNRKDGLNLGLLHCDLDQLSSHYAPASSAELNASGLDGWLLGHIHAPNSLCAAKPVGYLGSVTGLDPGEPGAHGPWLIAVDSGNICRMEQLVLAPLRWERMELDLSELDKPEDAQRLLLENIRSLDQQLAELPTPPDAVGLRVILSGHCNFGSKASDILWGDGNEDLPCAEDRTHYFLEQVRVSTRPKFGLEELAEQTDPPGLLASHLLLLDRPESDPDRVALLNEAQGQLEETDKDIRWQALNANAMDSETTADLLRRSGLHLLEQMLAQQEERV
jgi:DNA repair protein SbcD/Mre11